MLQEFSVYYHIVVLHTLVLVFNVLSPETIVIVIVINRLDEESFFWLSFNLMDLCIWLSVEVGHATFNLGLYLKLRYIHFSFEDFSTLLFTVLGL